MGHAINYMTCSNTNEGRKKALDSICREVAENNHESGLYHGNLHWHNNIICDTYDEAHEVIVKLDNGWYDDHAVLFKVDAPATEKMQNMMARLNRILKDKKQFAQDNSVQNRKAEKITCKYCGSQLAKKYLKTEKCPVCRKDLRNPSILEKLKKYDERYAQVQKQYEELAKRNNAKSKEIKWLIKYEYHV